MSSRPTEASAGPAIAPETTVGTVRLDVADQETAEDFYQRKLGLRTIERTDASVRMGANSTVLVELFGRSDATPRPRGTTGLYHLAILVPTRRDLAHALARVATSGWPLTGASDHLVSEALYMRDPEGNGIEIYRDRPREEWLNPDGSMKMDTLPLDLHSLVREIDGDATRPHQMPHGTRMGHVHLQVADVRAADAFYNGVLGFDVTVDFVPQASFLSAGGYHHHLGVNSWESRGAPAPPPGSAGLRSFDVLLPAQAELERVMERLRAAGVEGEPEAGGLLVADPFGNRLRLAVAAPHAPA